MIPIESPFLWNPIGIQSLRREIAQRTLEVVYGSWKCSSNNFKKGDRVKSNEKLGTVQAVNDNIVFVIFDEYLDSRYTAHVSLGCHPWELELVPTKKRQRYKPYVSKSEAKRVKRNLYRTMDLSYGIHGG